MIQYKLAQTACMSVCKHIADTLKAQLLDDNVKQVSVGSLQQLNLDLVQCESKFLTKLCCLALHYLQVDKLKSLAFISIYRFALLE